MPKLAARPSPRNTLRALTVHAVMSAAASVCQKSATKVLKAEIQAPMRVQRARPLKRKAKTEKSRASR